MSKRFREAFLSLTVTTLFLFLMILVLPQSLQAAPAEIRYSPLFEASLQNTLKEFEEKESGAFVSRLNDAVTENVERSDMGDIEVDPDPQPDIELAIPGIPSYTSSYSCGATCGATCGSTCGATCTSTCSATCGTTCGATCGSTCGATCSSTCGSTCAGNSTCAGSNTCAGSSTCFGSSTCVGSHTCAGSSTCVGSNTCAGTSTCVGSSTCAGASTCFGTSTCSGTSTCNSTSTCSFGGACINPPINISPGRGSSSDDTPSSTTSEPIAETPPPSVPDVIDTGQDDGGPSDWAAIQVGEAADLNFIPEHLQSHYQQNITRQEFCALVIQFLTGILEDEPELKDLLAAAPGDSPFTDVEDKNVTWAYYLGIVSGIGNDMFNPNGNITRQEAAAMLTNLACKMFDLENDAPAASYSDDDQIADWAASSVDFVSALGIMSGIGDNLFAPLNPYTREQSFLTILRLYQTFIAD